MQSPIISATVLALSAIGLITSWHIYNKKSNKERLVCKIGDKCQEVVTSKYSTMFGIKNETLGMLFYISVAVLTVTMMTGVDSILRIPLLLGLVIMTGGATLYSLVLTYIQVFVLKEWCEYCLISAAATAAIFVLELVAFL